MTPKKLLLSTYIKIRLANEAINADKEEYFVIKATKSQTARNSKP